MSGYVAKSGRFCKRHPKEWGEKNSDAQKRRYESVRDDLGKYKSCPICYALYPQVRPNQKHCGATECKYEHHKSKDPVRAKAVTMGSCVRLGTGRTEFLTGLVRAALDKPCIYCSASITLKNASLDHIVPLGGLRGKPLQHTLDRRENLQIICSRCNRAKGNLSDRGFRKLVDFLRSDPEISTYVWRRIAGGGVQYMAWRQNQRRKA